jgi:hypothetical protein
MVRPGFEPWLKRRRHGYYLPEPWSGPTVISYCVGRELLTLKASKSTTQLHNRTPQNHFGAQTPRSSLPQSTLPQKAPSSKVCNEGCNVSCSHSTIMFVPQPVTVRATPPKWSHINNVARRFAADITAVHFRAVSFKTKLLFIFIPWARDIYCQNASIKTIWNNIIDNYISIRFFIEHLGMNYSYLSQKCNRLISH